MTSLVDNIISLEKEADGIIEEAHAHSKDALKSVDDELALYRDQLAADIEARLAAFTAEVRKQFEESLARASGKHAERLRALKELPEDFRALQVDRIVDRFNNW